MILEDGGFKFEVVKGWGKLPEGLPLGADIPGVAVDAQDRVYVFNRSQHPVIVFESDGRFLGTWGEDTITGRPHGITITKDGFVWCTDDRRHIVLQFTLEGKLLKTLGAPDRPSDTGYIMDSRTTVGIRAAGPFNRPTQVAVAPNGELYITDGYGNARVHRFSADGRLIQSWGEAGTGPGQFNLPHAAWVHTDGRVFVCDRENSRIQIFDPSGKHIGTWNMKGRPQSIRIDGENRAFVSILLWMEGKPTYGGTVMPASVPSGVGMFDLEGNPLARWGGTNYGELDSFVSAHGMCLDSQGNMYIVENGRNGLKRLGIDRPDYPSLRKLARLR